MADQDKHDKSSDELNDIDQEGYVGELLKELYASLDTTIDRKNQAITDLEAVKANVETNNAKVGITTSQSSAITTNTAKTGISTAQSTQLTQLGKSILECGKGQLTFAYDSKNSKLQFTYSEGKTSKKGTITLS